MQLFSVLIPLALAGGALSNVLGRFAASSCAADNCARAVTGTTATPAITQRQSDCLSESDATAIVNDFINLLTNTQSKFNTTLANQLLANDFTESSDSIDYLEEAPLGSVTFASKQAFIKGQGTQPPFPSVTTLNIFYTCHVITWRFQLNTTPLPVRGIDIFVTNSAKQIETIYAELNSGAFLFNLGRPECLANWTVSVQH